MTLSKQAWESIQPVFDAIIRHPFNQELMMGSLDRAVFAYYIEQDSLYLNDFGRCHALIATKVALPHVRTFLKYADGTFAVEQDVVHTFFKNTFGFIATGRITPATLNYTSYLVRTCFTEAVEIGIASLVPCFWVYREVGRHIIQNAGANNPYARWIETYASEEFSASVDEIIEIFNEIASQTTDAIRKRMLDAFYKSACLEWHFWNDAYHRLSLNSFLEKAAE